LLALDFKIIKTSEFGFDLIFGVGPARWGNKPFLQTYSGLKSPPSQIVADLNEVAPLLLTDLETSSSCLTRWQKSLIH
jgi:hypothetical protein